MRNCLKEGTVRPEEHRPRVHARVNSCLYRKVNGNECLIESSRQCLSRLFIRASGRTDRLRTVLNTRLPLMSLYSELNC